MMRTFLSGALLSVRFCLYLCAVLVLLPGWAVSQPADTPTSPTSFLPRGADTSGEKIVGPFTLPAGKYAVFHTSHGDFIAVLFEDRAPKTVANFVGLATGTKPWTHPVTLAERQDPLYNNTLIYQIVEDILIRGGDPLNKGTGGPGYNLEMESSPDLTFETPGMLAMQKAGAQSSGSRWFISLTLFPDWQQRYAIFGRVVGGLDVVRAISRRPTKRPTIPLDPTIVNSIEILEVPLGQQAKAEFSEEEGRRVLTVDRNFAEAVSHATPADGMTTDGGTTAESVTTATAQTTGEASP
ncbi:MAG: peptidylprolyl isomerase [Candidatus Sumerlaeaceae bacterium]|nr:peptidylprolyl isomerase [Candidatus Sumerlaeaceae bacterium]